MLKRRNKNNNLVDHCCTATYIHKSISLHHTIDKTDNMSLHINKNTLKKKNTYTHTNTNDRLAERKKKVIFKKIHIQNNWCVAMRSYEPEDCIEKKTTKYCY